MNSATFTPTERDVLLKILQGAIQHLEEEENHDAIKIVKSAQAKISFAVSDDADTV